MGSLAAVRILDSAPPGWSHRRRRLLLDVLLWAVVAAPVGYAGASPPYPPYALPLLVGKLLLLGVAVAASRRQPLVALVLVVLGSLVDGNFVFAIPVFSYLAGRRSATAGPVAAVFVADRGRRHGAQPGAARHRRGHLVPARLGAALRRGVPLAGRPVPPSAAGARRGGSPARRRADPRAARCRRADPAAGAGPDRPGDARLARSRPQPDRVARRRPGGRRRPRRPAPGRGGGAAGQRLRRHRATARDHRRAPRGGRRVAASERGDRRRPGRRVPGRPAWRYGWTPPRRSRSCRR